MKQLIFLLLTLAVLPVFSQTCTVAVAANAYNVSQALVSRFEEQTHQQVRLVSGASGTLAAQIRNGAPFDLFLSADTVYPAQLFKEGRTAGLPKIYATGKLVLCSSSLKDLNGWYAYLQTHPAARVAIASPAGAPYGKAAEEYLTHTGILDKIKSQIIYGTSITQVNMYITTAAVIVGFSSLSYVRECELKHIPVYYLEPDQKEYSTIYQAMVLLKQGKDQQTAARFYAFMQTAAAQKIFSQFGYR